MTTDKVKCTAADICDICCPHKVSHQKIKDVEGSCKGWVECWPVEGKIIRVRCEGVK
jgi:hypothetical protein